MQNWDVGMYNVLTMSMNDMIHYLQCHGYPNWRHTTSASGVLQDELVRVPHPSRQISTTPSLLILPPVRRTDPLTQLSVAV